MDQGYIYCCMKDGKPEVFADVAGSPNGIAEAKDGKLYCTQSSGRHNARTQRPTETGGIQIADTNGKVSWLTRDPLAPNDLCFGPDGWLYFTDPTRHKAGQQRRMDGRLFRVNVETGECELLRTVNWYPNGIAFGPDPAVYYADSGANRIFRIPLEGGNLGKEEVYVTMPSGTPDGFCFDTEGNLITAALPTPNQKIAEFHVYDKKGKLVERIVSPEEKFEFTNCSLGPDRVLYMTDFNGGCVFAIDDWPVAGLPLYPYR